MTLVQYGKKRHRALSCRYGLKAPQAGIRLGRGVLALGDLIWISLLKPYRAYWWHGENNFGDLITEEILHWLGARRVVNVWSSARDFGPALVGAGSILQDLRYPSGVVWGSGFLRENVLRRGIGPVEPLDVLAFRGPHSRDIAKTLGWKTPAVFCDPGLLLSMMYQRGRRQYEVGLVLHYRHAVGMNVNKRAGSVKVINALQSVPNVVSELSSCDVVVSTSLHGIIAAHSFGIPWIWAKMEPALTGDEFKFYDFMDGMRISGRPVALSPEEVGEKTLLRLARTARVPDGENVRQKQRDLLAALQRCSALPRLPPLEYSWTGPGAPTERSMSGRY